MNPQDPEPHLDEQMTSTFYLKCMVKSVILMRVAIEEVDVAKNVCYEEPGNDNLDSFNELVRIFIYENALRVPTNHVRHKVSIVNFSVLLMTFRNIEKNQRCSNKKKITLQH